MFWKDIFKEDPLRNEEILFMTGNQSVHLGEIFSEEKIRKCQFRSYLDKTYYDCDKATDFDDRVIYWHPLPKLKEDE